MINQQQASHPALASAPWKSPSDGRYAAFLELLSPRDRARMAKHEESCEGHGRKVFGELWKRLAGSIAGLAPHATQFMGNDSVTFFIPDGKYKQQVFALVQTTKETIRVFMPDVIEAALARKILVRVGTDSQFRIAGARDEQVQLDMITVDTPDVPACKSMLGWGRKAVSVQLNEQGNEAQVAVVEQLCKLAAEKWAPAPE